MKKPTIDLVGFFCYALNLISKLNILLFVFGKGFDNFPIPINSPNSLYKPISVIKTGAS